MKVINDLKEIDPTLSIETLYKAQPPFVQTEDSHAPLGVLLWNIVTDRVKCHICGKWLKFINNFHLNTHAMSQELYREKFGFGSKIALCSRDVSAKMSAHNQKPTMKQHRLKYLKPPIRGQKTSSGDSISRGKKMPSFRNAHASCAAQNNSRVNIIKNIVGRYPTVQDIRKLDFALSSLIQRRYGGLKNYYKLYEIEIKRRLGPPPQTDEFYLSILRKYSIKPTARLFASDLNGVSVSSYRRRFGSGH